MCLSPPPEGRTDRRSVTPGPGWKEKNESSRFSEETRRFDFTHAWDNGRLQVGNGHAGSICSVAVGEGFVSSGSVDGTVRVWSSTTGASITTLVGHRGPVLCLAVSGSFLFSGSEDGTIRAWSVPSGRCLASIQCRRGAVWSLAVNSAGTSLYSGLHDGSIIVWSMPMEGENMKADHVLTAHRGPVYALAVNGDCLYSAAADRLIKVWYLGIQHQRSLGSGQSGGARTSPPLSPISSAMDALRSQQQDSAATSSASASVHAWSKSGDGKGLRSNQRTKSAHDIVSAPSSPRMYSPVKISSRPVAVAIYEGHSDEVLSLSIYSGILFSGDAAGFVKVWETWRRKPIMANASGREEGPCLVTLASGGKFVRALTANGDALYVGGEGIEVWWWSEQCGKFELERRWNCHGGHVIALAAAQAPTGLGGVALVSGGMDKELQMWWMKSALPVVPQTLASQTPAKAASPPHRLDRRLTAMTFDSPTSCSMASAPIRTCASSYGLQQSSPDERSNHFRRSQQFL